VLSITEQRHGNRRNSCAPDDAFDDWTVREEGGRELGHYPTREAAELVARAIARKRGGKLVIELPDGRHQCTSCKELD
jgi:uncharacterized protein DUF2188